MYKFYAFLSRLKYINRWSLMRNMRTENVSEHSHQTAMLAHALGLIEKVIFNEDIDPDKCVVYALYHEAAEVLTGDLPTPIKYYNSQITQAYKAVEKNAEQILLSHLPTELKDELKTYVSPAKNSKELSVVKAADKLAALIKCIEELSCENNEFKQAYKVLKNGLISANSRSVNYFIENFLDAYYLNLDDLSNN